MTSRRLCSRAPTTWMAWVGLAVGGGGTGRCSEGPGGPAVPAALVRAAERASSGLDPGTYVHPSPSLPSGGCYHLFGRRSSGPQTVEAPRDRSRAGRPHTARLPRRAPGAGGGPGPRRARARSGRARAQVPATVVQPLGAADRGGRALPPAGRGGRRAQPERGRRRHLQLLGGRHRPRRQVIAAQIPRPKPGRDFAQATTPGAVAGSAAGGEAPPGRLRPGRAACAATASPC